MTIFCRVSNFCDCFVRQNSVMVVGCCYWWFIKTLFLEAQCSRLADCSCLLLLSRMLIHNIMMMLMMLLTNCYQYFRLYNITLYLLLPYDGICPRDTQELPDESYHISDHFLSQNTCFQTERISFMEVLSSGPAATMSSMEDGVLRDTRGDFGNLS